MRTRRSRRRLRALALVVVLLGTFVLAATAAAGLESSPSSPIPDTAFHPVVVDSRTSTGAGAPVAVPTADVQPLAEPLIATPPPPRPVPSLPAPKRIVVTVAPPEPATGGAAGAHSISGRASWYCRAGYSPCTYTHPDGSGFDAYAAAGPALRAAIGPDWRGMVVSVDGIRVKLIDWCQCYRGEPQEKLLDLYYDVYARTGSAVTIRW